VFVCSRHASWAEATAKVLAVITDLDAHPFYDNGPEGIVEYMHSLGRRPELYSEDVCLIHLPSSPDTAARDGIMSVLRLRGMGEHWPGGIVLVVRNEEARASLASADLFGGEPGGVNAFGSRGTAHRILVEPIRLTCLFAELSSVGQVWRLQWRRWFEQGPLGPLVRLLQETQARFDAGAQEDAQNSLAEAHLLWLEQRERLARLCDHGAMQEKTRAICECRVAGPADVHEVMGKMREVLVHVGIVGA
jgi:hypothetical protein